MPYDDSPPVHPFIAALLVGFMLACFWYAVHEAKAQQKPVDCKLHASPPTTATTDKEPRNVQDA